MPPKRIDKGKERQIEGPSSSTPQITAPLTQRIIPPPPQITAPQPVHRTVSLSSQNVNRVGKLKGTINSRLSNFHRSRKLTDADYNTLLRQTEQIIDKYNSDSRYDLHDTHDVHSWCATEIDNFLYNFNPDLFAIPVMYSQRFYDKDREKQQLEELKNYWINRLEIGLGNKAEREQEKFNPILAHYISKHLAAIIEIQPIDILQDHDAMRNLVNIEGTKALHSFSQQAHSSTVIIPEYMQIDIPEGNDPMEISIEPRKRKAEEELEDERPEKYQHANEEEEIRQTEEELMKMDEENQNELIEMDELRLQLQTTNLTPFIVQGIVNRIAQLKLEIYDQEQSIRSRLNAWNERQKILIPFRKYKTIVEQLNAKYKSLLDEAKQNYVNVMSDEMSARKALKFREKEEKEEISEIQRNEIISRQPQTLYEPSQPGLIIETSNPQTNEGIHKSAHNLQSSIKERRQPREHLSFPNYLIQTRTEPRNAIPIIPSVHQAIPRFQKTTHYQPTYIPFLTPNPSEITIANVPIPRPEERLTPSQLSIFNSPSPLRPVPPEISSILQNPPRRPIQTPQQPFQQPESRYPHVPYSLHPTPEGESSYIFAPNIQQPVYAPPQTTYSPYSRVSLSPQPPQPTQSQQPSQPQSQPQPQQPQQQEPQIGISKDSPLYMFFDKNKDQRFLKPITKEQLYKLREQDVTRKQTKVLAANRYDRKRIFIYKK